MNLFFRLILLVIFPLFVAGCGDDDDEPSFIPQIEQDIGGSGSGFVWLPFSKVTKTAVVLLPADVPPTVLVLQGSFGEEVGEYLGKTNGGRPTFLFPRPGCGYGNNLSIKDRQRVWFVPAGCNRYEL